LNWLIILCLLVTPSCLALILARLSRHINSSVLALLFTLCGLTLLIPLSAGSFPPISTLYKGGIPEIGLLVALSPFTLSLVLYQWIIHRIRYGKSKRLTYREYWMDSTKRTLLIFSPLLIVYVVLDLALHIYPIVKNQTVIVLALVSVTMILVYGAFPMIVRLVMKGRSMPKGSLRERLINLSERAKISISDVVVIPAGRTNTMNAWVSGTTMSLRVVFITDALLSKMDPEEILTVFAHELGHVQKKHLLLNLCFVICTICILSWISTLIPELNTGYEATLRGAVIGLIVVIGYNWVSRRFEFAADQYACELTGNREAYISALIKLSTNRGLSGAKGDIGFMSKLQTHPTCKERINRILES